MVGKIGKVPCPFGGLESCGSPEFQPDLFSSLLGMSFFVFLALFCCLVDGKLKGNTRKLLSFLIGFWCVCVEIMYSLSLLGMSLCFSIFFLYLPSWVFVKKLKENTGKL